MESNRPKYSISPLTAFAETIQRQKEIAEICRMLNKSTSVTCRAKNIDPEKLKGFQQIMAEPVEWLPMGVDADDIYRAFGISDFELKMRMS